MSVSNISELFPAMTLEDTSEKDKQPSMTVEDDTSSVKLKTKNKKKKGEEWRKFYGVRKSGTMFQAFIRYPAKEGQRAGRRVWVGTYKSPKKAALAYDQAASKVYGSEAVLNFPKRGGASDGDSTAATAAAGL